MLRCVIFGASSKQERICAKAFSEVPVESLSIQMVLLNLVRCAFMNACVFVAFGTGSKLERICAGAFSESSIKSLSIADSC